MTCDASSTQIAPTRSPRGNRSSSRASWFLLLVPLGCAGTPDGKPSRVTVQASDGLELVCEVRGEGDTAIVLLHGWCGTREFWKYQVDALAADYRVVAMDQAGHGESGKDREQWTVSRLAEDVEAVVKALSLDRVILVGHSMGGPVSLAAAKRMQMGRKSDAEPGGTIVAVIGVDTLHNVEFRWPEEQMKVFQEGFERDFEGTLRGGMRGMMPENADPELVAWITKTAVSQDRKMALGLMRDMSALDLKTLMSNLKVPVRCINAGPGLPFSVPTRADINGKYCDYRAVIIEGVGHFPMLEKPAVFNEKLREVLKEFTPGK